MVADVPLFAGLSRRHLGKIARIASSKRFAAGGELVRAGEPANAFYVILDGQVRVETPGRGVELKSGDFFGEMALIEGQPRSATIVTITEVYVMIISRSKFLKLLESEPKIALAIMATLTRRLRDLQAAATLSFSISARSTAIARGDGRVNRIGGAIRRQPRPKQLHPR
jgi:CRP/FNR family transcriptional regulator, cyclic AMP receptor protein